MILEVDSRLSNLVPYPKVYKKPYRWPHSVLFEAMTFVFFEGQQRPSQESAPILSPPRGGSLYSPKKAIRV